jgi:hypothetical protein
MVFINKITTAIEASKAGDLEPIFELDENSGSPEPRKKSVQKRSPTLRRKKEPSQFIHVESPTTGRKIMSRPMRTPDGSPSNSPPKDSIFHRGSRGSSTPDSSNSPTKAGSPPTTPPMGRRTGSKMNLMSSPSLNRGNSVLEKLSTKIRDNRSHHNHRRMLFHHRSQSQRAVSFNSPEDIKNFINGLKDSEKYRPIELDFKGSEIRASQLQVMLNHIALRKCRALILDGCSNLNTESFNMITAESRKLKHLDLSNLNFNHRDVNQSIAALILAHRKTLVSLNFINSENLDHSVLQAIMQCSELRFLNLTNVNFHYDKMTSHFFDSILTCIDQHLLHLLNKSLKKSIKLVCRLESLHLSQEEWAHLLTFKNLGASSDSVALSDEEWQALKEFRQNPDIREAVNLPTENWEVLLDLKKKIREEMFELDLPHWRWQDVYKLWTYNNPEVIVEKYDLEELIKITSANERLTKLNLTPFQYNLLSLPEESWDRLTHLYTKSDQRAALKLNDNDWQALMKFRTFSTPEWRALSISQKKLSSLNLSPFDMSMVLFFHQHLSFLPFAEKDYSHFFETEKFSHATLEAFILTDDTLKNCLASDSTINRLHSLHHKHTYVDPIPEIFIAISETMQSIYPNQPIDKNLTSSEVIMAFKDALAKHLPGNMDKKKTTDPKARAFKKDLAILRKAHKYTENEAFFSFLKMRINFLPTLFTSCPSLEFLDVSSFLLPFHVTDIHTIANSKLLAIGLNDLAWVDEDVTHFQSLFKQLPLLESLSFMNTGRSTDLPFYKSSLPNLKHLNLSHQPRLTVDSLRQCNQHFPKLEELNISFCPLLLDFPLVVFLLRNARNLQALEVDIPTLSFKNLRFILDGLHLKKDIPGLGKQLTSLTVAKHHTKTSHLREIFRFCTNLQFLNNVDLLEQLNT